MSGRKKKEGKILQIRGRAFAQEGNQQGEWLGGGKREFENQAIFLNKSKSCPEPAGGGIRRAFKQQTNPKGAKESVTPKKGSVPAHSKQSCSAKRESNGS